MAPILTSVANGSGATNKLSEISISVSSQWKNTCFLFYCSGDIVWFVHLMFRFPIYRITHSESFIVPQMVNVVNTGIRGMVQIITTPAPQLCPLEAKNGITWQVIKCTKFLCFLFFLFSKLIVVLFPQLQCQNCGENTKDWVYMCLAVS